MLNIKFRVFDRLKNQFFTNISQRNGHVSELFLSQEGEIYLHERDEAGDRLTHEKDLFGYYGEKKNGDKLPRFERNLYTGCRDSNQKKYFFNDIVCFINKDTGQRSYGVLIWYGDRLCIGSGEIENYHAIDSISEKELRETEHAGNIYQNANLIMGEL